MVALPVTPRGIGKALMFTAIALVALGLIKVALPDVWSKIPGLKEF